MYWRMVIICTLANLSRGYQTINLKKSQLLFATGSWFVKLRSLFKNGRMIPQDSLTNHRFFLKNSLEYFSINCTEVPTPSSLLNP